MKYIVFGLSLLAAVNAYASGAAAAATTVSTVGSAGAAAARLGPVQAMIKLFHQQEHERRAQEDQQLPLLRSIGDIINGMSPLANLQLDMAGQEYALGGAFGLVKEAVLKAHPELQGANDEFWFRAEEACLGAYDKDIVKRHLVHSFAALMWKEAFTVRFNKK
jgi:hypothetical protein